METIEEIKSDYKEGIVDSLKEVGIVENALRSHWAYQKISKKPDEFTPYQREDAFRQYVRSLEKNTFHFSTDDMKNFEDWHTEEYTVTRRFVYIFLDKQNEKFIPLYVGKTARLKERFKQHSEKDWFKHAKKLAVEVHFDDHEAGARETELIKVLTPLFNKQGGLGMSFQKNEPDVDLKVPKNNDVTNLPFASTKDAVAKYEKLGARTKHYLHNAIIKTKCTKAKAFAKRHLEGLQHIGNSKPTESSKKWIDNRSPHAYQDRKLRAKWMAILQDRFSLKKQCEMIASDIQMLKEELAANGYDVKELEGA